MKTLVVMGINTIENVIHVGRNVRK